MADDRLSQRLRAAELFAAGYSQASVAAELGVSRTTAMRWFRTWRAEGNPGLARRRPRGRPRKLDDDALRQALRDVPRDATVDRIAEELLARTGVRYHPGHVWRKLAAWGFGEPAPEVLASLQDPDGFGVVFFAAPPETE